MAVGVAPRKAPDFSILSPWTHHLPHTPSVVWVSEGAQVNRGVIIKPSHSTSEGLRFACVFTLAWCKQFWSEDETWQRPPSPLQPNCFQSVESKPSREGPGVHVHPVSAGAPRVCAHTLSLSPQHPHALPPACPSPPRLPGSPSTCSRRAGDEAPAGAAPAKDLPPGRGPRSCSEASFKVRFPFPHQRAHELQPHHCLFPEVGFQMYPWRKNCGALFLKK